MPKDAFWCRRNVLSRGSRRCSYFVRPPGIRQSGLCHTGDRRIIKGVLSGAIGPCEYSGVRLTRLGPEQIREFQKNATSGFPVQCDSTTAVLAQEPSPPVSITYASEIRAGKSLPHPRHWPLPVLNCPFLIFSASSIPQIVTTALSNRLNPSTGFCHLGQPTDRLITRTAPDPVTADNASRRKSSAMPY